MNYKAHYDHLIERALSRTVDDSIYVERHHIVPTCLGGTDDADNIVPLFADEHLIAHLLLVKIYDSNRKLLYAARHLTNIRDKKRGSKNKTYRYLKEKLAEVGHSEETKAKISAKMKGRIMTEEHKKKIGAAHKGKPKTEASKEKMSRAATERGFFAKTNSQMKRGIILSQEHKEKISNGLKGKTHSEKTKKLMSLSQKGKIKTEEHRQNLSNAKKGHKQSEETKRKRSESLRKFYEQKKT